MLTENKALTKQVSRYMDQIDENSDILEHLSPELQSSYLNMFAFWQELSKDHKTIFDIKDIYKRLL